MSREEVKVAAVVPAYNEEKTVGDVVRTLVASKMFDEVIVVSDGSTDGTAEEARKAGATRVDSLHIQGGKGGALLHGITHTDADVIMFADSDLYGFTPEHVRAVLGPVLKGQRSMNVGLRDRGKFMTRLEAHLPLIGGERALGRAIIENIPPRFLQGFMVEAALNYYCRSRRLSYGTVPLWGLKIRHKYEKVGWVVGLWQYIKMTLQVIQSMLTVRLARMMGHF